MALKIPSTLRLIDLKLLASKCGLNSSGTKPIISARLSEICAVSLKPARRTRILSIDMGIRNLAYCILDVPHKETTKEEPGTGKVEKVELPSIHEWSRLAVSSAPTSEDENVPIIKEAFDPATLSRAAYTLLRERLLLANPTHILIERQRFRSMGSKHILEWTIRVNMFESILYAVLYTLKAEGVWSGEVVAVTPGKVGPFWIGDDEGGEGHRKERKAKSAKTKNKGQKIDLVRRWLESGDVVGLGNEGSMEMARQYVKKWDTAPGRKKGVKEKTKDEEMGKLDDLADCLLQGMAWVSWEENKRSALRDGLEALLHQDVSAKLRSK